MGRVPSARRTIGTNPPDWGENLYQTLFALTPSGILLEDTDGTILAVNDALCDITGYAREELLGKNVQIFLPPAKKGEAFQNISTILAGNKIRHETENLRKDGTICRMELNETKVDLPDGRKGILVVANDVTERRHTENLLRIQQELNLALSTARDLKEASSHILKAASKIPGIDSGGLYIADKNRALRLLYTQGLSAEFIAQVAYYPADTPQAKLAESGSPVYGRFGDILALSAPYILKEGLRAMACIPIQHEGRSVALLNLATHTQDAIPISSQHALETIASQLGGVFSRLLTEQALSESRQNLETLFNNLEDFVAIVNEEGRILYFNSVYLQRLGYTAEELMGQKLLDLYPRDLRVEVAHIFDGAIKGIVKTCSLPHVTKQGTFIPVETTISRGTWDHQPVIFGISRDISERRKSENVLRRRDAILMAISFAAVEFLRSNDWTHLIQQTLDHIGPAAEVSRMYLFQNHYGPTGAILTDQKFEWCDEGIESQISKPEFHQVHMIETGFARWVEQLRNGQPIVGPVRKFPESERPLLESHNVRSLIVMPIFVQDVWWGFVGLDECREDREWSRAEIEAVRIVAQIIGAFLLRCQVEEIMHNLHARTRQDAQTKADLLKEINHRVKNNLIAIQGLLLSEQQHSPIEARRHVDGVITSLNYRIRGLLQVHQLLSEGQWSPVTLSDLAERIIHPAMAVGSPCRKVKVNIAASPVKVSPRQAGNLALVLNELATNTQKHAHPGEAPVTIGVQVTPEDSMIRIEYRDNGSGYPPEVLSGEHCNVGLRLVHQLTVETLRGSVELSNQEGAVTTLRIKIEETSRT